MKEYKIMGNSLKETPLLRRDWTAGGTQAVKDRRGRFERCQIWVLQVRGAAEVNTKR